MTGATSLRPLPFTVRPYDDEAWNGYLARVAHTLCVPTRALLAHLFGGPDGGPPSGEGTVRAAGIAMSPPTIRRCTTLLGLAPWQVRNMQLQRFHGHVLSLPPDRVDALDPVHGTPSASRTAAATAGWMRAAPMRHRCVACLTARPRHWRVTWRLGWSTVCLTHRMPITDDGDPVAFLEVNDGALLDAQQQLERLAAGTPSPCGRPGPQIVNDIRVYLKLVDAQRHDLTRIREPDTALRLDLLARALDWATSSSRPPRLPPELARSEAQQKLARGLLERTHAGAPPRRRERRGRASNGRVQRALSGYQMPTARQVGWLSTAEVHARAARIPQKLPLTLFQPTFQALLDDHDTDMARQLASLVCLMLAVRCPPAEAQRQLETHGPEPRFRSWWPSVTASGSQPQVWQAAAAAWQVLDTQVVDYRRRQRLALNPARARLVAAASPGASWDVARMWLFDHWACARRAQPTRVVPELRERATHLELTQGAALRLALGTELERDLNR